MKSTLFIKSLLVVAFFMLGNCIAYSQEHNEIDSLLAKAYERDQNIRIELMNLTKKGSIEGYTDNIIDSLMTVAEQMKEIDEENIELVSSLLTNGLPEGLNLESYEAIWLIIDHAGIKQQKQYLPLMKRASKKGLISANDLATLTDRIMMYEGKPQKYGTQSYTVNVDGKQMIYIWPVSNPRKLNRLRKEINTCSIEEYVLLLKESSGMEVIYEPKLTVKEMKKRGLLDHFDNTSEE